MVILPIVIVITVSYMWRSDNLYVFRATESSKQQPVSILEVVALLAVSGWKKGCLNLIRINWIQATFRNPLGEN